MKVLSNPGPWSRKFTCKGRDCGCEFEAEADDLFISGGWDGSYCESGHDAPTVACPRCGGYIEVKDLSYFIRKEADKRKSPPKPPNLKDKCQWCLGAKGGVPGNENVIGGVITCDYCHSLWIIAVKVEGLAK